MKRTRTLIILGGALLVLVGVIVAEVLINQHVDTVNTIDEVVLAFTEDELTEVKWTTDEGSLDFTQTEGTWNQADDEAFPIDQEYMTEFLTDFEEVHASFAITDVEDYSQYGLDKPVCTMTFTTAEGDKVLTMGGYSSMDSKRYISIDNGSVYLIDEDLYENISVDRDTFLQNAEIPTVSTLSKFEMTGSNNLTYIYDAEGDYTYTDSYNYYMTSDGGYKEISTSLATTYMNYICKASLADYVSYTASTDDLSAYGLAEPMFTVTVTGTDSDDAEVSVTISFGEVEKTDVEAEDGTELTAADLVDAYMIVEGSEIVYTYSSTNYVALRDADYDDLRPAEVLSLDWELATSMTAEIDGETYEFSFIRTEDETDESEESSDTTTASDDTAEVVVKVGDTEVDFDDIKAAISALSMSEFNTESTDKKQELAITVNQDKEGYEQMSLIFYQYDGDYCLITRNGETLGFITRTLMSDLREAINAITLGLE